MNLTLTIKDAFNDVLTLKNGHLNAPLENDSILLETGLDSLGFAILITRLEDLLGYDPFMLMDEPVYPQTFGEFVDIYAKFSPFENNS